MWPCRRNTANFCSSKCWYKFYTTGKYHKCKYCGKQFWVNRSKEKAGHGNYCSVKCFGKSLITGKYSKCAYCGKKLWVKPYQVKANGGKYCSQKCYGLGRRDRVKRKCVACGKEFITIPSFVKYGWGKYCSKKCMITGIKKKCKWCGKPIWVIKSRRDRTKENFCSYECKGKYYSGEINGNWIDGRSGFPYSNEFKTKIRDAIILRDRACKICGKKYAPSLMRVHHIDFNKSHNKYYNLIAYCIWCHGQLHGKLNREIVRNILRQTHKALIVNKFYIKFRKAHSGEKASIMAKLVKIYKHYPAMAK